MTNLGAINWKYEGDLNQPDPDTPQSPAPAQMYGYLIGKGANPNEAHMLTGAAASESELDPSAVHDGGVGYGMFGHNGSRLLAMKQYAQQSGQPLSDWRTQASFALNELRSRPEGKAAANATTPEQLALAEMHYEQPQGFTPDNPTAGHNYTGRLNTIRLFTGLNPNAAGAFAPSANPQITPEQAVGAGLSVAPVAAATNAPSSPAGASAMANPFGQVGNAQLNAALYKIITKDRPAGQQPLVDQLLSPITQPLRQAIAGGDQSLRSGLSNLLGGGDTSDGAVSQLPSPSTPAPSSPAPLSTAPASASPLLTSASAQATPSTLATPTFPPMTSGGVSAPPLFTQPSVLSALNGLLGGGAAS